MLRALGRRDEALKKFTLLIHDKEWATRTRLRAAECTLKRAMPPARVVFLKRCSPHVADEENAGVLRGRLELSSGDLERAIGIFQGLLKRPEGAAHPTQSRQSSVSAGSAKCNSKRPKSQTSDRAVCDRHPADPDLPLLFARLDELYRAEHKPSRNELGEMGCAAPKQPRRTFARWYLARFRNSCRAQGARSQLFTDLRHAG